MSDNSEVTTAMQSAENNEVAAFYAHEVDPTESEHTDLDEVPEEARIEFKSGVVQTKLGVGFSPGEKGAVADAAFDDTIAEGVVLTAFIERAMLDPDAKVIPL